LYQTKISEVQKRDLKLSSYRLMQNRCLRLIATTNNIPMQSNNLTENKVAFDFGSSFLNLEEAL
jgi:hypothetical protein